MPTPITYQTIKKSNIDAIKKLWQQLNNEHYTDSIYFKDFYKDFTFEKRAQRWQKWEEDKLFILVAYAENNNPIGYCVSTIENESIGEIDSLCVDTKFQKRGIGKELTIRSIDWLKQHNCKKINLAVSSGHENVIEFYQKLGFYPRLTVLELKEKN